MSRYKNTLSLKIARRIGSLRDEMLTLNMQCQLSLESRIEECRRELERLVKMCPKEAELVDRVYSGTASVEERELWRR